MSRLRITPSKRPLVGSVPLPADKSLAHRALILAALAKGTSQIRGFSYAADNVSTLRALGALGVSYQDDAQGQIDVTGAGLFGLKAPEAPIDCGNSGTTMRLLAGVLAGQPFASTLTGDESLKRRPMARVVLPLTARGARIDGQVREREERADILGADTLGANVADGAVNYPAEINAPLEIHGLSPSERLNPLEYGMPIPSAQVKSALLFSGLYASGQTLISEPLVSRDHTERLFEALRLPIETMGGLVKLHPPADPNAIQAFNFELPGDLSAAAFLLAAGLLVEGSTVTVRRSGLNPTRAGFLDMIKQFYGSYRVQPHGIELGESFGSVSAGYSRLVATEVGGEVALRSIDEIPIAAALAARAKGESRFFDLGELRHKESDRIAELVKLLQAFGISSEENADGFVVQGRPEGPLKAATVSSQGDHRLAMTAAVLGLLADGESIVEDAACIAVSFPRFVGTLRALGAQVEVLS